MRIQLRRGNAKEWEDKNPVLYPGEPGVETDTGYFKIGDGETSWNELDYVGEGNGSGMEEHDLGGKWHNTDTLENLNSKISDASLDDKEAERTPAEHDNDKHSENYITDTQEHDNNKHSKYFTYSDKERKIHVSTQEPTEEDGEDGDLWFKHEE